MTISGQNPMENHHHFPSGEERSKSIVSADFHKTYALRCRRPYFSRLSFRLDPVNILDRSSSSDVRKEAGERTKGIHYTWVALSNTKKASA
jgi:hypothetical protein